MPKQLVLFQPPFGYRLGRALSQPALFSLAALVVSLAGFDVSFNSLMTARESLHIGQQPYLSITLQHETAHGVSVLIKNLGNTPAQKVRAFTCNEQEGGQAHQCDAADLFGSDLGSRDSAVIGKGAWASWDAGVDRIYHYGEVEFDDVFQQAHSVRFCFTYRVPSEAAPPASASSTLPLPHNPKSASTVLPPVTRPSEWLATPCDSNTFDRLLSAQHFVPNYNRFAF